MSDEVDRKFAAVMRKHKRTKVGEVLDLLDKDGGTRLYKDGDIKQIKRYLTKLKDNVRKVAHQMMIDYMEGDDYLAKKRIPIKEERVPTYVIDRQSKKIVHGPTDTADAKLYMKKQIQPRKFMIRQIRGEAKKVVAMVSLMQLDPKLLNEDGHTDVASAKMKVDIAAKALIRMQMELNKLPNEASLPSWWTNKVAVAVDNLDGMADYLDSVVESEHEEDRPKKKKQLTYKVCQHIRYGRY